MNSLQPSTLLIVDLEATCWNAPHHRQGNMETIEIGAILVDTDRASQPREYQAFVRPTRFPQLSEFCRSLTSIQQQDVDDADPFPVAFAKFLNWVGNPNANRFSSWGEYDRKQILRDCQNHRIPYPFADGHFNIKRYFAKRCGCEPQGMGQVLKRLKIELKGTHHRALDDARNILHILSAVTNGDLSQVFL
jgi:inhibitor of KinA sporulation pathway (predicted exonuclease)